MNDANLPSAASGTAPESSTGLTPNVAGALAYLLGPITGVLFLLLEKRDPFVRFHAGQSIGIFVVMVALSIALSIVSTILGVIPAIGWLFALLFLFVWLLIGLAGFALWIWLMYSAYSGREWEFPLVAPQVRRLLAGNAAGGAASGGTGAVDL